MEKKKTKKRKRTSKRVKKKTKVRKRTSKRVKKKNKVAGWNINIGNKNIWKLNLLSFDSDLHLDNIKLEESKIAGTGKIYLGKDLELEELRINGNFEISVSQSLSIVAMGKVDVPPTWINATIGYLNQAQEVYQLKVR